MKVIRYGVNSSQLSQRLVKSEQPTVVYNPSWQFLLGPSLLEDPTRLPGYIFSISKGASRVNYQI